MQQEFELTRDNFRLARIGEIDARHKTDDFFSLRKLVFQSETSYPRIGKWFDGRVLSGLRTGERTGFVGLVNDIPVAAAILRRGITAKFCHLKVDESMRGRSLGDLFFSLMALEIRQRTQNIHFTLPESVWEDRKSFFHSFSFQSVKKSDRQYRLFDTELHSSSTFQSVFEASKKRIPRLFGQLAIGNHSLLTGAVLAIHPTHLEKIFSGEKTIEIRTRFSNQWEGKRASLYATSPISGIAGEATIERVITASPDKIWEHFGHLVGCDRQDFESYAGGRERIYALVLSGVQEFADPIPLQQLSYLLNLNLSAPQSYLSLENNDGWLSAVTLAAALQGSIRFKRRVSSGAEPALRAAGL
jgi:predicted transcriptional regulator